MNTTELTALIRLTDTPGFGPARVRALVGYFRTATAALAATAAELCRLPGIDRRLAQNLRTADNAEFATRQIQLSEKHQAKCVTYWDANFPALLKQTYDPPVLLHVKGHLAAENRNAIAIVGTRAPTEYGKLVTERLAGALVDKGLTIVSGLARGIDTIAHQTAVKKGGRTIAVLGSGLDVMYPSENRRLAQTILRDGAVVTEFSFGTKPDAVNFPRRNRIISGLSLGVVIVEAGLESGAMITANFALNQGREVFAVPGNITSSKSAGPHRLLREGAKLVETVDDILEELQPQLELFDSPDDSMPIKPVLAGLHQSVYEQLSSEPLRIDLLQRQLNLPSAKLLPILLDLEIEGFIKQLPGTYFVRA